MLSKKREIIVVYCIFLYAICFPLFYERLESSGAILVNGGLIIWTFLYFLFFGKLRVKIVNKYEKRIVITIIGLFSFYLFAILFSTLFLSERLIFSDLYEIHRPVLYSLVFITSLLFFNTKKRLKNLEVLLLLSFLIVAIFGINHYFGIEDLISAQYTKAVNIRTRRISTPFPNPYDYGFYLSLPFCYCTIRSLRSKISSKERITFILLSLISIIGIILTQSRTGFIILTFEAFVIPTVLILERSFSLKALIFSKKIIKYVFLLLIMVFFIRIFYITYGENFGYLFNSIERIVFEGSIGGSGTTRLNLIELAIENAGNDFLVFLFGSGPSKAILKNPEAGYAYFIFRYGFSTLFFFFFFPLLISISLLVKIIKAKIIDSSIYLAILAWYLSVPVVYLATNATEQIRLSFIYYFLMGFIVKSYFILPNKEPKKLHK